MRATRNLILGVAWTVLGQVSVHGGETWDRLGRLWGFGWSAGYHACGVDRYRIGENLPPPSHTAQLPFQRSRNDHRATFPVGTSRVPHTDPLVSFAAVSEMPATMEKLDRLPMPAAMPGAPTEVKPKQEPLPAPTAEPATAEPATAEPISPSDTGTAKSKFPRKLSPAAFSVDPVSPSPSSSLGSQAPARLPLTTR